MRTELEICSKPKQGTLVQDYIGNETFFEVRARQLILQYKY